MLATSGTVLPFLHGHAPAHSAALNLVSRPPRCWSGPGLEIGIPIRERAEWGFSDGKKRVGLPRLLPLNTGQLTFGSGMDFRATEWVERLARGKRRRSSQARVPSDCFWRPPAVSLEPSHCGL